MVFVYQIFPLYFSPSPLASFILPLPPYTSRLYVLKHSRTLLPENQNWKFVTYVIRIV